MGRSSFPSDPELAEACNVVVGTFRRGSSLTASSSESCSSYFGSIYLRFFISLNSESMSFILLMNVSSSMSSFLFRFVSCICSFSRSLFEKYCTLSCSSFLLSSSIPVNFFFDIILSTTGSLKFSFTTPSAGTSVCPSYDRSNFFLESSLCLVNSSKCWKIFRSLIILSSRFSSSSFC